jgi:hypothetical protein
MIKKLVLTVKKKLLLHFRMRKGFSLLPNKISSLLKYLSPGIFGIEDCLSGAMPR